jgi:hypothetical protein
MIPPSCKRLAEVDFPIAVVSKHSAREKSIRHGHPSTLHLWWARRPLAACRSMLLALGLSSLAAILMFGLVPPEFFPQMIFGTCDSFTLLAIPFFVFAGIVLGHTSISRRLIDLADSVVGDIPGGLGIVGIARWAIPLIAAEGIALAIITMFPELSLFLPSLF